MPPVRSGDEKNKKPQGARRSSRVGKKEREKRRAALKSQKSKRAEEIENIQAKIDKTNKELKDVEDDHQRNSLEDLLSKLNADRAKRESDLQECDAELEEIDQEDKMDIDEDQGNGEDIPGDSENAAEENEPPNDTQGQKAISDTGPNSASESSEEAAQSAGTDQSRLEESREQPEAPPSKVTAPDKSNDNARAPDEHDQVPSGGEESSSPTRSHENVRFSDSQGPGGNLVSEKIHTKPHSFIDCVPVASDSRTSDGYSKFSLENGTVIIQAQEGKLNLNKYGPNNSAIYIWSGTPATSRVEKMTMLHGFPHNLSMGWDDVKGVLKWKYKITAIRSVAWKPKKVCDSMLSVLDSVEELNPANKQSSSTYTYPFSCAFVDLVDGENRLTVCITRSDYKRLSKGGKESHAKIDRKFYMMACGQVQRYRDWAGKDLDPKWDGEARIGTNDRDLTPMHNTPEPETTLEVAPAGPVTTAGSPTPEPSTSETSTPETSTPETSTSEPSTSVTTPSRSSTAATPSPGEDNNKSRDGESPQATVPISKCYKAFLGKNKIAKGTPLESLEEKEELYWAFIAAAEIWMMQLKKSNVKVIDDMDLEGILEI